MPRKSTKNNTESSMSAIDEAINTPVNFQFCEVAEALGIGDAELRERLEDKTGSSEVHQMDTIPCEWEPAIKAIKIDLEAESSVRRLNEATEPPVEQVQEPPVVQDEPQSKKRGGGRKKKDSTALTKKGSTAIENSANTTDNTQNLEEAVLLELSRLRGDKRGSNMAAVEDVAEQERYTRNRKNTSIWQRAKRLLASDTRAVWRQICEVIEADEQRYINECRAKGISPYIF